jgi:hypothetical protein
MDEIFGNDRLVRSVSSCEEGPGIHAHGSPHGLLEPALGHRSCFACLTQRPPAQPGILLARHGHGSGRVHLDQNIRGIPLSRGKPQVARHPVPSRTRTPAASSATKRRQERYSTRSNRCMPSAKTTASRSVQGG